MSILSQMDCTIFLGTVLFVSTIILTGNGVGARNDPKIFTKGGSVHIRSGDNGNIVFEHPSSAGKIFVGGQELNVINSTGPKGDKGDRGSPGTSGRIGIKGDTGRKGEPGLVGDPGERGKQGLPGSNGTVGSAGVKGDGGEPGPVGRNGSQGPPGLQGRVGPPGQNGSNGHPGLKGDQGNPGPVGQPGNPGPPGTMGLPGLNGTVGEKGADGTPGSPGVKGEKGDIGYTSYLRGNGSGSIQCNSSNFGVLRYSSNKLQLCTPHGWRYLSFEPLGGCNDPDVPNVPETNYQSFLHADLGTMFDFNEHFVPNVISRTNLSITADISPANSNLTYKDAVMRQAAFFGGRKHLKVFGISDDFWRNSNWSVMALLKFKDIGQANVMVLGHGSASNSRGLHLGIVNKNKEVIHGYYSNDLTYATVKEDTWYHITWTSEKDLHGKEKRCIVINGNQHKCDINGKPYLGSGVTTVGTWWHETLDDSLLLDNLIITSSIPRYKTETAGEKQECFARTLDANLP